MKRFLKTSLTFPNSTICPAYMLLGAKMYLAIPANFAPKYSLHIHELLINRRYEEAVEELFRLHIPYYGWINEVASEGVLGEGVIIKEPMRMVGLPSGPARPPYNFILKDRQKRGSTIY